MAGITSFGAYIPRCRLPRELIFKAMGWSSPFTKALARGEKAVANYDEDSITMAVAAGRDCLRGQSPKAIGALYLASTTLPYQERQNAGIVAGALDLSGGIRSMDVTGKVTGGTTALIDAIDAVKAGSVKGALVCAADTRLGKMGGALEYIYADGGAAIMVGDDNVAAELVASNSVSYDFPDVRRAMGEKFARNWEERWIRDEGIMKIMPQAVKGLLMKAQVMPNMITKLIVPLPDDRAVQGFCGQLGLGPEAAQPTFFGQVGDTGNAFPLMLLCAALEDAKPGDMLLLAAFGAGADAMLFKVTDNITKLQERTGGGVKGHIALRRELDAYEKYCVYRDIVPKEVGIRAEIQAPTALSVLWRERKTILALHGSKCKACGTPQFPPQRICVKPDCGAIDQMDPYPFADKNSKIFTFTADMLAYCVEPPQLYGVVDFEGGGRLWVDFTDCKQEELKVDMPMKMSFRLKYVDKERSISTYFWKAVPDVS